DDAAIPDARASTAGAHREGPGSDGRENLRAWRCRGAPGDEALDASESNEEAPDQASRSDRETRSRDGLGRRLSSLAEASERYFRHPACSSRQIWQPAMARFRPPDDVSVRRIPTHG